MICQICNNDKFEHIMNINHKCLNCGHIYIDGPADLESYYNNEYRNQSPLPSIEQRSVFIRRILERANSVLKFGNKRVLEIGAADGLLSEIMVNRYHLNKIDFYCNDIDKSMMVKCDKKNFNIRCGDFLKIDEKFDILVAIDIIEHIPNITIVKDWIKEYFKSAIIQVPRKRGPKTSFKAHFHVFSDKSLNTWLKGFNILGVWDNKDFDTCFGNSYLRVVEIV